MIPGRRPHQHPNGAIQASKGIDTVTHPQVGACCASFTKELNLDQTASQVTAESADFGVVSVITWPHGWCGSEQGALTVVIRGQDGLGKNLPFALPIV